MFYVGVTRLVDLRGNSQHSLASCNLQDARTAAEVAEQAAAGLLAEEEQSAAQAVAKKAKKLRQKAKKQKAQPAAADSSQPSLSSAEEVAVRPTDHHADSSQTAHNSEKHPQTDCCQSNDQIQPLTGNLTAVPTTAARELASNGLADRLKDMHMTQDGKFPEHAQADDAELSSVQLAPQAAVLPWLPVRHMQEAPVPAAQQLQSSDAAFLQSLVCCPIAQVSSHCDYYVIRTSQNEA